MDLTLLKTEEYVTSDDAIQGDFLYEEINESAASCKTNYK